MKIKEVSELCGLSIDTIRYYERIGLIEVKKTDYFKYYDNLSVETLIVIKKLRLAGLTISEIKKLNSIDKEVNELSAKDVDTVSKIVNRAITTADVKLQEIMEAKQLLEKMKTKLQKVHYGNC